jgi:hypothetical protein
MGFENIKIENDKEWDVSFDEYSKLSQQADEISKKLDEKFGREEQLMNRFTKFLFLSSEVQRKINEVAKKLDMHRDNSKKLNPEELVLFEKSEKELAIKFEKVNRIIDTIVSQEKLNDGNIKKLMDSMNEIRTSHIELEKALGFLN